MSRSRKQNPFYLNFIAGVSLLPFVPFWIHHAWYNSQQSNLAHTPVLAVVALWLLAKRYRACEADRKERKRASVNLMFVVCAFMAAACLGLAVFIPSNLFGSVGGLFAIWAVIRALGTTNHARELRTNWLLLFLCLPLPRNWMESGVAQLQRVATYLASGLLDILDVKHIPYGVTLQSVRRVYLIEEACSGINALYAALAFVGFILVYQRTSLIRSIVILLKTVVWVVLANALRVFAVVIFDTKFDIDLTSGWLHQVVGLVTFVLAISLTFSFRELLQFCFPVVIQKKSVGSKEPATEWFKPIVEFFSEPWSTSPRLVATCLTVFLITNFGFAVPYSLAILQSTATSSFTPQIAQSFPAEGLFGPVDNWTLTSEAQREDRDSLKELYGATSYVWTYEKEGRSLTVSVDGMFNFWHDLAKCYKNSGWKIAGFDHYRVDHTEANADAVEVKLVRDGNQHGYVVFSLLDIKGAIVEVPSATTLWNRSDLSKQASAGLYQIQVMADYGSQPTTDQIADVKKLFQHLRSRLSLAIAAEWEVAQ